MKKFLLFSSITFLDLLIVLSCSAPGTSPHDVLTMKPVDAKKMLITVRTEANINDTFFEQAVEKQFPTVDLVFRNHIAPETMYELRQSLSSGDFEDMLLSPHFLIVRDIAPEHLLDLSGEPFVSSYQPNTLNQCTIDGKLYFLPGPSDMYGIVYDKTLFEKYGWAVPQSYTEFISLCKKIDSAGIRAADSTRMRAFQPTCKYARQSQLMFTMFCYDSFFGGVKNYEWLEQYQAGKTYLRDKMIPAFDKYHELFADGIIRPEDFDMQPGTRSDMMYTRHSCAMIVENQMAETYGATFPVMAGQSRHEYGMIPFWSGDSENDDHVLSYANYYIALNKNLSLKKNKAKLAVLQEILSWISTPQGQLAIAGGKLTMVSSVTNTPMEETEFNSGIQQTIKKGNAVPEPNLMASGNNNPAEKALQKGLRAFLENKQTAVEVCDFCDKERNKALAQGIEKGSTVATATTDFTRLETAEFIADALRNKTDSDIALVLVDVMHCGVLNRIYKGAVTQKDIATLTLSNGKGNGMADDQKLWVIQMSGSELKEFIQKPYLSDIQNGERFVSYFAPSGLKVKFAPWATPNHKIKSLTLANGQKIIDSKTYTVSLWGWPFGTECTYVIQKVYDDSFDDILTTYCLPLGTLTPPKDKRIKLSWSTK